MTVGLEAVTRRDFDRANERAENNGEFGEYLAAAAYGVARKPDEEDWYDLRHLERGTKYEVKTTQQQIDGRDKSRRVAVPGRFRLWESQLRSLLTASGADGQTAWVVFVLLDADGSPVAMRRVQPSTVWRWVTEDYDGWDASGHENEDLGRQQKLPVRVVFPDV